jgi:hypothetical protein
MSLSNVKIVLNLPKLRINKSNQKANYIGFIFGPRGHVINGIQIRTDTIIKLNSENKSELLIFPNTKRLSDTRPEEIFNKLNICVNIIIALLKSCYENNKHFNDLKIWQDIDNNINSQVYNNMDEQDNSQFKLIKKKIVTKLITKNKLSKDYYSVPILDTIEKNLFLNNIYLKMQFKSELKISYTVLINKPDENDDLIYIENFSNINYEIKNDRELKIKTPTNLSSMENESNFNFDPVIRPIKSIWNGSDYLPVNNSWDPMFSQCIDFKLI